MPWQSSKVDPSGWATSAVSAAQRAWLQALEQDRLDLAALRQRAAQGVHQLASLAARVAGRGAGAQPVARTPEERDVGAAFARRLPPLDRGLATDQLGVAELALHLRLQPQPVPSDDRPDELRRVEVFRNQLCAPLTSKTLRRSECPWRE